MSSREAIPNIRRNASRSSTALIEFVLANIKNGTWKPGHQLPTERELEEKFGIARNTLRKSLRILEAEGRITRQIGRGTFVAAVSPDRDGGQGNLSVVPIERRMQTASPAEIMDVRLIIEPQAIEFAAARATGEDLHFLMECLTQSEMADSVTEFEHWDGALHSRVVAAASNGLLSTIYNAINSVRDTAAWGKLKERSLTPDLRKLYEQQHRRIVLRLQERDADLARQELREHLLSVRDSLIM